jgi:DNA segregation ATPase FtsK/SpoIIIE-like protein
MAFKVEGKCEIVHLNVRKQGEEGDKELAVDLTLLTRIDAEHVKHFDDQVVGFLWMETTKAVRNPAIGDLTFAGVMMNMDLTIAGIRATAELSKFSISPADNYKADVRFKATFKPTSTEIATLAELVSEQTDIKVDKAELPLEPDAGVAQSTARPEGERKRGGKSKKPTGEVSASSPPEAFHGEGADDPLLANARRIVVMQQRASISLVQRQLQIGYNRAARLLEALQSLGVVSAMDETGQRKVTETLESAGA